MGAAKSKAQHTAAMRGSGESAREVLTRRAKAASLGVDKPSALQQGGTKTVMRVEGSPNSKKPVFNDYNR